MNQVDREPFVIISAVISGQTKIQFDIAHLRLKQRLNLYGFDFKEVQGKYNGEDEISLYVPGMGACYALIIAKEFEQETYLLVDEKREAYLVSVAAQTSGYLGYFMIGESETDYTIDQGVKYVCSKS